MVIQGNPMSMISVPIKSAYTTSQQEPWSYLAPFIRYGDLKAENHHLHYRTLTSIVRHLLPHSQL